MKKIYALLIIFFITSIFFIFSNSDDLNKNKTENEIKIIPSPQYIETKNFYIKLDDEWAIITAVNESHYNFSANLLKNKLIEICNISMQIFNGEGFYPDNKRIFLGNPNEHDFIKNVIDERNITVSYYIGNEGYIIEIFNDSIQEIIIAGNAPNGVFYGIQTLIQLLNNNSMRGVFILDYPDNKMRGVYEGYKIRFEWNGSAYEFTQEQKDYIDWLASLKFNTVFTVENGIFFKNESQWKDAYEEFFEYCRERFIEPVPRLCSISSVSPFPFEFYEGWFVENESFIFNESFALPEKPFINLLPNGDFEIDSDENGIPDNWTVTSKPGAIWKIDNDSYSGNHSMKLEVPEPTQNSTNSYLRIEIEGIEPNSHYCLLSKAKAKNITNVRPQLTIYTKNASGGVGVVQSDITWSTDG